jgi:hypothetical protein
MICLAGPEALSPGFPSADSPGSLSVPAHHLAHLEATMQYRLADHGLVFSTRDRGARMLADIREERGDSTMSMTIDFSGVRSLSYSFVDEFLGEMLQDAAAHQAHPVLTNVPPAVSRTIERSLRRRGLDAQKLLHDALELA